MSLDMVLTIWLSFHPCLHQLMRTLLILWQNSSKATTHEISKNQSVGNCLFLSLFFAVSCSAMKATGSESEVKRESCDEVVKKCHQAVYEFSIESAAHLHCSMDIECISDKIMFIPGICCYTARRDWWNSQKKQILLKKITNACGFLKEPDCPRHRCQSICLDGRCSPIFNVVSSGIENE